MSSKDKNNLIIVAATVGLIGIVVFFQYFTKYLPLRWIGILALVCEFLVIIPLITKKYLALYDVSAGIGTFIPIYNSLCVFPRVTALLIVLCVSIAAAIGVLMVIPSGILVKILGSYVAMNIGDTLMMILNILMYVFFAILGAGYCSVLHDLRKMSRESSGTKASTVELIYYPLLFIPIINMLGLAAILSALARLETRGYSAVKRAEDEQQLVEE